MEPRLNPFAAAPTLAKQYLDYSKSVTEAGLEAKLIHLVEIRSSQINGCANCLNLHTSAAYKGGETDQRLHLVAAWQDAPVFTDREQAALAWTEHLTRLSEKGAPDDVYASLDEHFTKEEQIKLTLLINVINAWNRIAVGFRIFDPSLGW